MLLKDKILEITDEYVYIGAKNAFITIGKTKEFDSIIAEANDYHHGFLERNVQELYTSRDNLPNRYAWGERLVKNSKERIDSTKKLLEEMTAALGELADYVKGEPTIEQVTTFSEEYAKLEDKYETFLAKHVANGMANALQRLNQVHVSEADLMAKIPVAEKRLEAWIPFEEREVISEYKRDIDNGTILIVEGDEWGRYWSLDEVGKDITELEEDEDYE